MASTVAMYTALSGLNAAARNLDVIGNNIANVNTAGFKSARVQFADNFYQTLRGGSAPTDSDGGSNPVQIGLGVSIGGVARSFAQGSLSVTGEVGDLALEGPGFFVVNQGTNRFYTRGGSFRLDAGNNLVTSSGHVLQGYLANDDFTIPDGGPLSPLSVPLGGRAITEPTSFARLIGNLNSTGSVADNGSTITFGGSATAGLRVVTGATPAPGAGEQILGASLLTDIEDPATAVGSGTRLFALDQIIEVRGAKRGTATIEAQQFTITATSTIDDLNTFLSETLGIQSTGANPDGSTPGVTLDPTPGIATIVGNTGATNDFSIPTTALRLLDSAGAV
ncbi:MAG: flagellar hook-basal body complex protein, partial [Phycisphaerales bacterium]